MATGSQDPADAERGRLRAGHADREQAVEELKTAFVDGRLTKDDLAARTGRALAARTYADLAALTADLPPEPAAAGLLPAVPAPAGPATAEPAAAEPVPVVPAGLPAPAIRRPMAKAGAMSGICLAVAVGAMKLAFYFDPESGPGPHPDQSWAKWFVVVAFTAFITGLLAFLLGVAVSVEQWHSRRQLPPGPGSGVPDGRVPDGEHQRGTGHNPVPPGHRADETQADLRPHKSRPRGRTITARPARAPGGVRPAPGAA